MTKQPRPAVGGPATVAAGHHPPRPAAGICDQRTIAIIGMGCRFPGGASTPERYWRLLREGRTGIVRVPEDRWDADAYFHIDRDRPGTLCSRAGGFLEQIDLFDADFFHVSPREAASLDPQQRLALEVAWEALEDAARASEELVGSDTGVFLGVTTTDFERLELRSDDPSDIRRYSLTGTTRSLAAGRISYFLGLTGPSLVVDTACSSSLVAIHLACRSLLSGECRMALAGGVNVILDPAIGIAITKMHLLSRDGGSHSFEAEADGFGRGEGCGMLVLKRWDHALADGDRVIALIRGSAVNQNGHSAGVFAPHGPAQAAVIRRALADAGIPPEAVGYVEAQGIGTALGHVVEVRSLAEVLSQGRPPDSPLLLGSVKGNIGHLESASGVAGVIKLAMAIQAGELPPNIHSGVWNPAIDQTGWNLRFPTQVTPWEENVCDRIAGINAFSFCGTNAHLLLQGAPAVLQPPSPRTQQDQLYLLSARTSMELRMLALRHADAMESIDDTVFADACFSAAAGRRHFAHRLVVQVDSWSQLQQELRAFVSDRPVNRLRTSHVDTFSSPSVAWWFSGNGNATLGEQVRSLMALQPAFQQAWQNCLDVMPAALRATTSKRLSTTNSAESASQGENDCFLFVVQFALASMLRDWGITPSAVLGIGVGNAVAGCVAGRLPLAAIMECLAAGASWDATHSGAVAEKSEPNIWLDAATGKPLDDLTMIRHNDSPAREVLSSAVRHSLDAWEIAWLIDAGPAGLLSTSAETRLPPDAPPVTAAWDSVGGTGASLAGILTEAYLRGFPINFSRVYGTERRGRLSLPTYPFRRKRYWPTDGPRGDRSYRETPRPATDEMRRGRRLSTAGAETIFESRIRPSEWERAAAIGEDPGRIYLALLSLCLACEAGETLVAGAVELRDVVFPEVGQTLDRALTIQAVVGPEADSVRSFCVASVPQTAEDFWTTHARGELLRRDPHAAREIPAAGSEWRQVSATANIPAVDTVSAWLDTWRLLQERIQPAKVAHASHVWTPIRLRRAWWEAPLPAEWSSFMRYSLAGPAHNDDVQGTWMVDVRWQEGGRICGEIQGFEIAWRCQPRTDAQGNARNRILENLSDREAVLAHLSHSVREILGTEPGHPLDAHCTFRDLGMDSLMAVELAGIVERLLRRPVPPALFFTCSTLAALAEYVVTEHRPARSS